jgi:hypothetical protein
MAQLPRRTTLLPVPLALFKFHRQQILSIHQRNVHARMLASRSISAPGKPRCRAPAFTVQFHWAGMPGIGQGQEDGAGAQQQPAANLELGKGGEVG